MSSFLSVSSTNTCNSNAISSSGTSSSSSPGKNNKLLARGSSGKPIDVSHYSSPWWLVEQETLSSQTEQKAAKSLLHRRTNSILDSQDFTIHKLNVQGLQGHLFGRQAEIQKVQQSFLNRVQTPVENEQNPSPNSPDPSTATTINTSCSQTQSSHRRPASLCSITGYSGTGKSVLVEAALLQEVNKRHGFLVRGKFDLQQQQRGEPYTAIAAALGDLVDQILQRHKQQKQKPKSCDHSGTHPKCSAR